MMKKLPILFSVFFLIVASLACVLPTPPNSTVASGDVSATPSLIPTAAPTESATPEVIPSATQAPSATPDGLDCIEDPLAVTSFADRDVAKVNDVKVEVQVRGSCPQPVFYDTTGVANGENYKLDLPTKWSAIIASVSMQIHPDGGTPTDYKGCPFVIIRGPFNGSAGVYEGAVRIVPSEWEQGLIDSVLPIHSAQCGKSINPTIISGQ